MGREIRKVPPNWVHPQRDPEHDRYRHGGLQPMHDQNYADAKREWIEGLMQWEAGTYPGQATFLSSEWWDYAGAPPEKAYYRPWKDEEATWFQIWETVSEGTPTSPPFATKEELADYLAENGDFWDQERCKSHEDCRIFGMTFGKPGWGRERAYRYVMGDGWSPTLVVADGKVMDGVEFVTRDPS
jgi:hypothetical protein